MLTVALPPELERSFQAIALEHGKSGDEIVRELVERFVEDQEDIRLAVEAKKVPGRRWTLDELEQGLDLES